MRVFKTKWFVRYARRAGLADADLAAAVGRIGTGLIDADLGGGVIKQRVARPGAGKSGGFRVLLAWRDEVRAVFLYGFAKNERDNIGRDELTTLRELAASWFAADEAGICRALDMGELEEIDDAENENT